MRGLTVVYVKYSSKALHSTKNNGPFETSTKVTAILWNSFRKVVRFSKCEPLNRILRQENTSVFFITHLCAGIGKHSETEIRDKMLGRKTRKIALFSGNLIRKMLSLSQIQTGMEIAFRFHRGEYFSGGFYYHYYWRTQYTAVCVTQYLLTVVGCINIFRPENP